MRSDRARRLTPASEFPKGVTMTEKKKTEKKTSETKAKTPEADIEAVIAKYEKRILPKLDELNRDLDSLAAQIVVAQKALAEDLGIDLNEVWIRMQGQTQK